MNCRAFSSSDQVDDMPLIHRRIVFMHNGCPAHFAGKNLFKEVITLY